MPKRNFASRLFGYDVFLSFALGPPPRGTLSYASDLARRLQEHDFTVFFSEQEMPPGEQLGGVLAAIGNRGNLTGAVHSCLASAGGLGFVRAKAWSLAVR